MKISVECLALFGLCTPGDTYHLRERTPDREILKKIGEIITNDDKIDCVAVKLKETDTF